MDVLHHSPGRPMTLVQPPSGDAAVAAWNATGLPPMARATLLKTKDKSQVYRLGSGNGRHTAVAKRGEAATYAAERSFYERVRHQVPDAAPRYFGSAVEPGGWTWLFMEYAGEREDEFDTDEAGQLVGSWLGRLHAASAALDLSTLLPDATADRYAAHLRRGRNVICDTLADADLDPEERAGLQGVVEALDGIEHHYDSLRSRCDATPRTLVHADLAAKNLRLIGHSRLVAIDWETVGWGSPAADLGWLSTRKCAKAALRAYRAAVATAWPATDPELRSAAALGQVFRMLAAIDWETTRLGFASIRARTVSRLVDYRTAVLAAVATPALAGRRPAA